MSLMKREPKAGWPLAPMWTDERIDRVFRDMFRDAFAGDTWMDRLLERTPAMLRLEEYVEGSTCVIRAEMPGIDPDKDVEITVSDGLLHLSAHREEKSEDNRPDGYRSEFRYGSFERSIRLPADATEADVKASYKDGILEVRVPIAEEPVKPTTRISVDRG